MDKVGDFFHFISPKIISLTNSRFLSSKKITYKDNVRNSLDIATEGDIDNEKLIIQELSSWFPEDKIVAEETSSDVSLINNGRAWIIDPICGSANLKNGIRFFSTNIAVAQDGKLIASCVVDHSRQEYIWSIGESKIYIGKKTFTPQKNTTGIMIEVDLSALTGMENDRVKLHTKLISFLLNNKNYYLSSFCTSLAFAYTALGRIDAYANGFGKVWDVAAANFLTEQAGGRVTELNGNPWTLSSDNVLGAFDIKLHAELLNAINS